MDNDEYCCLINVKYETLFKRNLEIKIIKIGGGIIGKNNCHEIRPLHNTKLKFWSFFRFLVVVVLSSSSSCSLSALSGPKLTLVRCQKCRCTKL